ncbi:6-hydroxymethylpterin diphosphokinase MptE-like protein [Methanosphaera cuniculi]|uniref:6-hydroxymethylpterin diphosphokinase MptE-like protein n=1 Tax=Methanosphaera cuniculi TaxID=1077256 RepID=UPI0026F21111|nr:6-hydroxymethylpterin diphosphokinase MptE-like protein [Methanosphaera cuniculi]
MCRYNNWDKWYVKILDDFNFSMKEDIKSANLLNELIMKKGKFNIDDMDVKKQAIIFGAGPSIKKHITYLKENFKLDDYTLIAADGTTEALMEEDIIPDIIVTDLDGKITPIKNANHKGSILYVHAHGDNIDKIQKHVKNLENIIPTTQAKPTGLLENYGGFTDGDRAVHIAIYALGINDITMAGMDFGTIVTRYSRPNILTPQAETDEFKEKKLDYASKLIKSLSDNNKDVKIVNLVDIL